jgi:hypothetical protein
MHRREDLGIPARGNLAQVSERFENANGFQFFSEKGGFKFAGCEMSSATLTAVNV